MNEHVTSRFLEWSEGRDSGEIRRHLDECASCRGYYERMAGFFGPGMDSGLKRLPPDPSLPGRIAGIVAERAAARAVSRRATLTVSLRGAAFAAAVLLGVLVGITAAEAPPEPDLSEIVNLYRQAVSEEDFSIQLDKVLDQSGGDEQ